jgi:hypothetical protein
VIVVTPRAFNVAVPGAINVRQHVEYSNRFRVHERVEGAYRMRRFTLSHVRTQIVLALSSEAWTRRPW